MTAPPPIELRGLLRVLQRRQSQQASFVDFLGGMRIEDVHTHAIIPFEPWPHLMKMAKEWSAGTWQDVLKARQEGGSWLACGYAVDTAKKPHTNVLLISQGQEYAYEMLRKCQVVGDNHAQPVKFTRANKTELVIQGGGTIRALPSTENAGRGYTANLVIMDEAASHPMAEQSYQSFYPTVADGGQLITISTSKGPQGWFYRRYQATKAADELALLTNPNHVRRAIFIPWDARPDRDQAWYERTVAELGLDLFRHEYPASEADAFASSTGLALPFDMERHVRPDHPVPWQDCFFRGAGLDPGGDDPTALVLMGAYRVNGGPVRWHQYGEIYRTGTVSIDDMVSYLYEHHCKFVVGDFGANSPYVGQFARYGIKAFGAKKNREVQWRKHAEVLRDNRLTIHASCESVNEYYSYWWDSGSAVPFATKTGEGHHADSIQAREYLMVKVEAALNRGELGGIDRVNLRYTDRQPKPGSGPRVRYAKR